MNISIRRIKRYEPNIGTNDISIGEADIDGIIIKENETGIGVYIYYIELNKIIKEMKKLYSRNSIYTKKEVKEINKDYNNVTDKEK
jgi:hypothetical protein